MHSNINY